VAVGRGRGVGLLAARLARIGRCPASDDLRVPRRCLSS
jgi:hypothetical protein